MKILRCLFLLSVGACLFQLTTGCVSTESVATRSSGIFLTDMNKPKERELTRSEAGQLGELIDLSHAFDHFNLPSNEPIFNAPSPNPNIRYHIYSDDFHHNGYYFLSDGTPLYSDLSEDKTRTIAKFIKNLAAAK